jgi:hypothetical protein
MDEFTNQRSWISAYVNVKRRMFEAMSAALAKKPTNTWDRCLRFKVFWQHAEASLTHIQALNTGRQHVEQDPTCMLNPAW